MTDIKHELKPCPFCGCQMWLGDVQTDSSDDSWQITYRGNHNDNCPLHGGELISDSADSPDKAIAAWNTRSSVEGGTVDEQLQAACEEIMINGSVIGRPHFQDIRFDLTLMVQTIKNHLTASPTPVLTGVEKAAEEIATKADEGWPALRCDKCGSLELIRNVPEDGYDCRGCSNFTRTPDEVIGITKIDLEKLATAILTRHLEVK